MDRQTIDNKGQTDINFWVEPHPYVKLKKKNFCKWEGENKWAEFYTSLLCSQGDNKKWKIYFMQTIFIYLSNHLSFSLSVPLFICLSIKTECDDQAVKIKFKNSSWPDHYYFSINRIGEKSLISVLKLSNFDLKCKSAKVHFIVIGRQNSQKKKCKKVTSRRA